MSFVKREKNRHLQKSPSYLREGVVTSGAMKRFCRLKEMDLGDGARQEFSNNKKVIRGFFSFLFLISFRWFRKPKYIEY